MMTTYTAREKFDAADREVRLRERVYPRRVSEGRMTQALAAHRAGLSNRHDAAASPGSEEG